MANSKEVFEGIKRKLTLGERDEIEAIALALMRHHYGFSLTDILSQRPIEVLDLASEIDRLNGNEPLQYVLGEADFYGRKFEVSRSTLIPRPETELLVSEILRTKPSSPSILDIGTGSGCIAITLGLEIKDSKVCALDKSEAALNIAAANSRRFAVGIDFELADFLKDEKHLAPVDIVVSNPPYVRHSEKRLMKANVLDYEPHQALFVPDEDPLLFYKAIASKGKTLFKPSGKVFLEINENFGQEVKRLFDHSGFKKVRVKKDLDLKDRILIADAPS
jgi:release factor glutamine methyltransferase